MWEFIYWVFNLMGYIMMFGFPIMFLFLGLSHILQWAEDKTQFFLLMYGIFSLFIALVWGTFTVYFYFIW